MGLSDRLVDTKMKTTSQKPKDRSKEKSWDKNTKQHHLLPHIYCFMSSNKGLTLVELLIVVGILGLLFSITFISIFNVRVISTNSSTASVLTSDLKNQQIKAMVGDTEGRGTPDNYGVKILSNQYVLFHGASYNPADTTNFSVPVESGYTLSSTFPNTTILFASESGEIVGFVQGQNTITLTNTSSGKTKTLHFNKYGTIIQID